MKIVILEANSLGKDVSLKEFGTLGDVTIYGQSTLEDTPQKIEDADVDSVSVMIAAG